MSKTRRNMCVIILLALLLVPAVQVVAATQTFFTNKLSHGFSCTASGTISSSACHLYFTATALPTTPVQPWENYQSAIHATAHKAGGQIISIHEEYGNCNCDLAINNNSGFNSWYVDCDFWFMSTRVGLPNYTITY